jgi:hypothetical protein
MERIFDAKHVRGWIQRERRRMRQAQLRREKFVVEFERKKLAACAGGDRSNQPSWVINPWPHKTVVLTLGHSDHGAIHTAGERENVLTMTPPWPLKHVPVRVDASGEEVAHAGRMDDFEDEEEEEEEEPSTAASVDEY